MLNPCEKRIDGPINSLTYNITSLVYLVFKIAINIRDGNLRFSFRLYAVVFLRSKVKL